MAASHGLTRRSAAPVAALGVGELGSRIVGLLPDVMDAGASGADDLRGVFWSGAPLVVLAAWRPSPRLFQEADRESFLAGKPWLPVVIDRSVLRMGPLVHPPYAPCFMCFARRHAQHDVEHRATATLYARYDNDEQFGPGGYLPQHARIAAALVSGLLDGWRTTDDRVVPQAVGEVREVRLFDQRLTTWRVVPCHDCRRCAPADSPGPVGQIQSLVTRLVSQRTAESEVGDR